MLDKMEDKASKKKDVKSGITLENRRKRQGQDFRNDEKFKEKKH